MLKVQLQFSLFCNRLDELNPRFRMLDIMVVDSLQNRPDGLEIIITGGCSFLGENISTSFRNETTFKEDLSIKSRQDRCIGGIDLYR